MDNFKIVVDEFPVLLVKEFSFSKKRNEMNS